MVLQYLVEEGGGLPREVVVGTRIFGFKAGIHLQQYLTVGVKRKQADSPYEGILVHCMFRGVSNPPLCRTLHFLGEVRVPDHACTQLPPKEHQGSGRFPHIL